MKSIAFGTLKGGTGKTTTCFNLAGGLALNPKNKILLVDGDPQCNLTNDIGIDCSDMERNNIRTIFENKKITPQELIIKNAIEELPNIDIIPSNILLLFQMAMMANTSIHFQGMGNVEYHVTPI